MILFNSVSPILSLDLPQGKVENNNKYQPDDQSSILLLTRAASSFRGVSRAFV